MLCSSTTVHHCIILYMTTEQLHSHENLMLAKERCTVESLSCTGGWCMYVWIFNWTCVWLYVWTSTSPTVRPLDIGENTAVHTFHYLVYHTAPIFVLFVKYQVFVWLAVETQKQLRHKTFVFVFIIYISFSLLAQTCSTLAQTPQFTE